MGIQPYFANELSGAYSRTNPTGARVDRSRFFINKTDNPNEARNVILEDRRIYTMPDSLEMSSVRVKEKTNGILNNRYECKVIKNGKAVHTVSYSPRSQKPSKLVEGKSLLHADGSSKLNVLPGELRNHIFDQAAFSLQKEGKGWLGALLDLKQSGQTRTALEQDPKKFNKSHPVTQRDILEKAVDSGNQTLAADLSHGLPAKEGSARAKLTQKRDTVLRNTFAKIRENFSKSKLK